ncbi:MAG: aminotransferase class V-fold PLP-dependent enzyme [Ahrensia sp.]|nr:aminotransferase class V-fold PLP-dependent enzyme [Ahrensia sp.]
MLESQPGLMDQVRERFAHVSSCPFTGERVFFENAGGALTLKSVVETSAKFAAIPDNQGRANDASHALMDVIAKMRADTKEFLGASSGQVFLGESGTELLFRLIRTAIAATPERCSVVGSTLEHPATRSPAMLWSKRLGHEHVLIAHDDETGSVDAQAYADAVRPDTKVATIIHTSPVTGMGVDIAAVSRAIRAASPDCIIIVDGIQHAAHGGLDIDTANVDAYVMSSYKVFSRHGYGIGWISDRFASLPHESLVGGPVENWELGTRDTGAYATFIDVIDHFEWLGSKFKSDGTRREKILAAAAAIHDHEAMLTHAMLHGTGNLPGLAELEGVIVIGGVDNSRREGLVSFTLADKDDADLVEQLGQHGIRVHIRKADHYSGNILEPLGLPSCVRVSLCHYNTTQEVAAFLAAMKAITVRA